MDKIFGAFHKYRYCRRIMTYPEVKTLIPHRSAMLFADRIISVEEATGTVECAVKADNIFLRSDGTLSPEIYCEMIAQSFGACEAFRRTQKGLTIEGGGYLANMRDGEVYACAKSGDILTVKTEKTEECFSTYIVRGEVYRGQEKLGAATVYIFMWQGDKPPKTL